MAPQVRLGERGGAASPVKNARVYETGFHGLFSIAPQSNQTNENTTMNRTYKIFTRTERAELIQQVESSATNASRTLQDVGVSRSTYYGWKRSMEAKPPRHSWTTVSPRRIYALERALRRERAVREVLAVSPCTAGSTRAQKLAAMAELHESGRFTVHALCAAHGVDRGTFYNYMKRGKVRTGETWYMRRREEMKRAVERIFHESEERFGAGKIVDMFRREGVATTYRYVKSIMRELGLKSIRQNAKATFRQFNARRVNIVARQFNAVEPNAIWVGDVTYFRLKGRTFYVCAIIDLYSRMVVSHRVGATNSTRLTKSTFADALRCRQAREGLVFHSDQGANYTSRTYARFLRERGVKQSFSATRRPCDNAVAECFFRNLKTEELYRRNYRSFREFRVGVADYIRFYNERRPHFANNGRTPLEKDMAHPCRASGSDNGGSSRQQISR